MNPGNVAGILLLIIFICCALACVALLSAKRHESLIKDYHKALQPGQQRTFQRRICLSVLLWVVIVGFLIGIFVSFLDEIYHF